MAGNSVVDYTVDDMFSTSGIGSLDKAIGLNLYGINYQHAATAVPRNKEQPGYVFFTRPQLNFQRDNIANVRQFYNLLAGEATSQERYIRCMLDPRLGTGYKYLNTQAPVIECPLLDNENPFIPVLTNNIMTATGWPEQTMTFQRSKEDVYRGTHSMPNGLAVIHGSYTLSCTFRNTYNNPILKMMHYWLNYMGEVTVTGRLRPYADYEAMDYIDSNTRIYRITLDAQRERVTGIFCCGAAAPSANSISQFADYNREAPITEINKDFTISFDCDGMLIFDPIAFYTFNAVVQAFCPGMRDEFRDDYMVKLTKIEQNFFNNLAYPRINPDDSMFEQWVYRTVYESRLGQVTSLLDGSREAGLDYSGEREPPTQGGIYYA